MGGGRERSRGEVEAQTARFLEGPRRQRPLPLGKRTIGASQRMLSILVLIGAEETGEGERGRQRGLLQFKLSKEGAAALRDGKTWILRKTNLPAEQEELSAVSPNFTPSSSACHSSSQDSRGTNA